MRVGFIGLGAMGLPMARRVAAAGHPLHVLAHRNRAPVEELAGLGAQEERTPAEVARRSEVVITILPADRELREVALGPGGLREGFSAGKALVEMTTATAFTVREVEAELSKEGVAVLDAPVSGGVTGAIHGTLTIMAGGEPSTLERLRPLLETMGRKIVLVGAVGQGKVVKMVNQVLAAVNLLAIGEAFALGARCGADPRILYEVIRTSSGHSAMMDSRVPEFLLEGRYEAGFRLDLMRKDLNLALDSAQSLGIPLLFGSLAAQVFAAASQAGRGEEDFSAAAAELGAMAGVELGKSKSGAG